MKFLVLSFMVALSSCQSQFIDYIKPFNSLDSYYIRAVELENNRKYEDAIKLYKEVIIKKDDRIDNRLNLARLYRKNHQPSLCINAISGYDSWISPKYPAYISYNEELGLCYLDNGNLELAEGRFYNVLSSDAINSNVLSSLGTIKVMQSRYKESEQYFEMALDSSSRSPKILNNYAIAKVIMGKKVEAKILFEEALKTRDEELAKEIQYNLKSLR